MHSVVGRDTSQQNFWWYIVHVRECVITNASTCTLYMYLVVLQKIEIKSLLTQLHVLNFI